MSNRRPDDVWARYATTQDVRLRNELAEQYVGIVYKLARRMKGRVPHNIAEDELVSAGFEGLLEAIRTFDPGRGVKFGTYCPGRIRGAMLDYLRRQDFLPRLTRTRANRLEEARVELERTNGRPPRDAELAAALGVPLAVLDALMADIARGTSATAPRRALQRDEVLLAPEAVEDRRAARPMDEARKADLAALLCRQLRPKERYIVVMYYAEDLTLAEIALVLGLSESRVCQLHAKALEKLRARGRGRGQEAA